MRSARNVWKWFITQRTKSESFHGTKALLLILMRCTHSWLGLRITGNPVVWHKTSLEATQRYSTVESDFWFMAGQVCTLIFLLLLFQALHVEEFKKLPSKVLNKCLYGKAPPRGPNHYPWHVVLPEHRNTQKTRNTPQKTRNTPRKPGTPHKKTRNPPQKPRNPPRKPGTLPRKAGTPPKNQEHLPKYQEKRKISKTRSRKYVAK